ncbi:MAG: hypothetical protein R3F65_32975 [bacterium]
MSAPIKVYTDVLASLYPHGWNDKDGDAAKFDSEDAEYRTYKPTAANTDDGGIRLKVEQDHIRGGATDDHVTLKVYYAADGTLTRIKMSWEAGNDGYTAPDWVIDLTAYAAEAAVDGIIDVLSEGALVEIDPIVAEITGKVVHAIGNACNYFSKLIVKLSDDGGRLNFIAVANHNLNKLVYAVSTGAFVAPDVYVAFSNDRFEDAIGHHFNDKDDQAMEYESNDSNYRTWKMDDSPCFGGAGLYVSTKIDHIRGGSKDDHAIVMMGYNAGGKPIQGQAALQIKGEDPIITDIIQQNADFTLDLADAVSDAVKAKLKSKYGESNSGRQNIPHVIQKNINAMNQAVYLKRRK